jgi:hypothetical protein
MAKRRGNPNWGKPEPFGPVTPTITELAKPLRLVSLSEFSQIQRDLAQGRVATAGSMLHTLNVRHI